MSDPVRYISTEMASSPFDLLTGALQRALLDRARDSSELQRAILACARAAHGSAEPPQRFLIRVKECVRRATLRESPMDVAPIMSRVVARAVDAYYDQSHVGRNATDVVGTTFHDRVR